MADERKDWLRALRTVNDDLVLELLDEAIRRERAEASLQAYTWAQQEVYGRLVQFDNDGLDTQVRLGDVIDILVELAGRGDRG